MIVEIVARDPVRLETMKSRLKITIKLERKLS